MPFHGSDFPCRGISAGASSTRSNAAIRSDLPGQFTAQVTQNVHDTPTGNLLPIPQGTRLICVRQ